MEHWQTHDSLESIKIGDFDLTTSFCRQLKSQHGGVALYTRPGLQPHVREDVISLSEPFNFECCGADYRVGDLKLTVVVVYNLARNGSGFLDKMEELLETTYSDDRVLVIAGDYNVDLLSKSKLVEELVNLLTCFSVVPTVTVPTRVTNGSSSCIDNVFVSCSLNAHALAVQHHVSDHLAQVLEFKIVKETSPKAKFTYRRNFSDDNVLYFYNMLVAQDWFSVCSSSSAEDSYNSFIGMFLYSFNHCFPLYRGKVRQLTEVFSHHKAGSLYSESLV